MLLLTLCKSSNVLPLSLIEYTRNQPSLHDLGTNCALTAVPTTKNGSPLPCGKYAIVSEKAASSSSKSSVCIVSFCCQRYHAEK